MSDAPEEFHPVAAVHARLGRRWRFSLIWAIPIVTAAIGGWLAWDTLSHRGPRITITFRSAEGLQAGQSHVRYKAVDMGLVETIALTPDLQKVAVTVRMTSAAETLLTQHAKFWVVKPRFFAGAVSGLETLVSGSYIGLQVAEAGGEAKREFTGFEDPPVLESNEPGHTFLLQSARIGNINLGSPVYFRDLTVGEVLGWDIADMAESVTLHVFVRAPYDRYVHDGTRFWNASGASIKLGANGIELQLESLRALVLGGIAFDTPVEARESPISAESRRFPLYASKETADAASYEQRVPMLAHFGGSVAGLSTGAPVLLRGIRIGEVLAVSLQYDPKADNVVVAVQFDVEPQRIAQWQHRPQTDRFEALRDLVRRGLRVRLDSASLITGQKQLAIDLYPDAPVGELQVENGRLLIPALSAGSDDVMSAAGAILAKLNAVPFEQIGNNLNDTLKGVSNLANGEQLRQSLASLQGTLAGVQDLVKRVNAGVDPMLQRLPAVAAGLEDSVRRANRLIGSLDTGYGGNSTFNRDLARMMLQLTDTARSLRVLADLLTRHPEALIRGRADQGP
ncbi:MAG: MlaD family protein [Acetobacteraceae bacterium]